MPYIDHRPSKQAFDKVPRMSVGRAIGWGGAIRNKNGVFSALFFITLKILKYETLSCLGNLIK